MIPVFVDAIEVSYSFWSFSPTRNKTVEIFQVVFGFVSSNKDRRAYLGTYCIGTSYSISVSIEELAQNLAFLCVVG